MMSTRTQFPIDPTGGAAKIDNLFVFRWATITYLSSAENLGGGRGKGGREEEKLLNTS